MTSKTSYFEPALFLRGLKKTFPVWLAYVVLWVLFLPLSILNRAQWDPKAADIRELILSGAIASVITTAVLALALAWVLFRFLFRTTTAYDIAALPVRRESLFLTNLLCGLAIALGTHLLIALITYGASALIGLPNFGACLQLVAAAMLAFLGFFGFAVLLCIIVGNAVAMPLIYIVLNFTVCVVVQISTQLLSNFVYGLGSVSSGDGMRITRIKSASTSAASRISTFSPQWASSARCWPSSCSADARWSAAATLSPSGGFGPCFCACSPSAARSSLAMCSRCSSATPTITSR